MIEPAIEAAVARLRGAAPVERVILFGSRARADHDRDSDWDLLVVLSDDIPAGVYTPLTLWPLVADLGPAIQVFPVRRSVFEAKSHDVNALAYDAAREGIVLYEAEQAAISSLN
ncbi:hypothetical protein GCM10011322_20100 [Salinarimonas ramus]|uniref:Polymerase beta nucleotidyltransferase domain-containing protein n=1 Tax=Salinarimonas ramus TaxID=690164 RepID=A0A917Q796_9HYPH|nr:hypothetical protein GCM10011322_20100 [Salinarimonas ramus]